MTKLECDSVNEARSEPGDSSDDFANPISYVNVDPERLGYMPIDSNNTNVYSSDSETEDSPSRPDQVSPSIDSLDVNAELYRIIDSVGSEITPRGDLSLYINVPKREFDSILSPEEDVVGARDIDLNAEKKSTILNLMNEIKIPQTCIPEWAKSLDEKSLLEAIHKTCKR